MKNGRTIIIRDPKLQKIRNNLRFIILKESSKRKSEIRDQKHDVNHDKDGNYIRTTDEGSKILQELTVKWWEIERPLRASIIKCPGCNKHKNDMTFHRKTRTWYCVQCYKRRFN